MEKHFINTISENMLFLFYFYLTFLQIFVYYDDNDTSLAAQWGPCSLPATCWTFKAKH